MKITPIQYTAFCFALGWVIADACQAPYSQKLFAAFLCAFVAGLTHNVHGIFFKRLRTSFRK